MVYDDPNNCGVGVSYGNNEGGEVWGLILPRNLIAAWRATEILRCLDAIEEGTLASTYYTGLRGTPQGSDLGRHVGPTIEKIGVVKYREIMSMPVPEEIIRAILDNQVLLENGKTNCLSSPDLYPITQEVQAGTIAWREEFERAGVTHPNDTRDERRVQRKKIEELEPLLASYARKQKLQRGGSEMQETENGLYQLIRKGVDKSQPHDVLVALSGILGALLVCPKQRSMHRTWICEKRQSSIDASAKWLVANRSSPLLMFWRNSDSLTTFEDAKELLSRLFDEHFPQNPEATSAS